MKIAPRLLLGTLATAAALGGAATAAHADTAHAANAPAGGSADEPGLLDSTLCPIASSGPIGTVLNNLNPESIARSCGGLHNRQGGLLP